MLKISVPRFFLLLLALSPAVSVFAESDCHGLLAGASGRVDDGIRVRLQHILQAGNQKQKAAESLRAMTAQVGSDPFIRTWMMTLLTHPKHRKLRGDLLNQKDLNFLAFQLLAAGEKNSELIYRITQGIMGNPAILDGMFLSEGSLSLPGEVVADAVAAARATGSDANEKYFTENLTGWRDLLRTSEDPADFLNLTRIQELLLQIDLRTRRIVRH